jgi:hypothetical protein
VAQPHSKRRSRKRHKPRAAARPASVKRRERPLAAPAASSSPAQRANPMRAYGEPPPNRFGGVPVSEIAIFAGGVSFVVGLVGSNAPAAVVGAILCTLGVLEFTQREHFSGYRSHTALLAAFPAVVVYAGLIVLLKPRHPAVMLLVMVPIFALAFAWLRGRFLAARQLRLARPPAPPAEPPAA